MEEEEEETYELVARYVSGEEMLDGDLFTPAPDFLFGQLFLMELGEKVFAGRDLVSSSAYSMALADFQALGDAQEGLVQVQTEKWALFMRKEEWEKTLERMLTKAEEKNLDFAGEISTELINQWVVV